MSLVITELYVYPIKGCGGISVQKADLSSRGFLHDRRWMIVDENGVFLSQRDHPHMCLLETAFRGDKILVRHEREPHQSLEIGIGEHSGEEVEVVVWQDRVRAMHVSKMADDWFSRILGASDEAGLYARRKHSQSRSGLRQK